MMNKYRRWLLLLLLVFPLLPWSVSAAEPAAADQAGEAGGAAAAAGQVVETGDPVMDRQKKPFTRWLHMLDNEDDEESDGAGVLTYAPQVPGDLGRIFGSAGGPEGGIGFLALLLRTLAAIGIGYLVVRGLLALARGRLARIYQAPPPEARGLSLFWVGVMRAIPQIVALLCFTLVSTIVFLLLAGDIGVRGRMFFQTALGTVLIFSATALLSRIIFAPEDKTTRPVAINEALVRPLHRAFYVSIGVLASGVLLIRFVAELGAAPQTVSWVVIVLGTAVIVLYSYLVRSLRLPVAEALVGQSSAEEGGWLRKQAAQYWHVFAQIYLVLVWFVWIGQMLTGTATQKGAFIVSMLIVPLFFLLNHFGRILVDEAVRALNLGYLADDEFPEDTAEEVKAAEREQRRQVVSARSHRVLRLVLLAVLVIWLLSLYGVEIPFAAVCLRAMFESLVALALALVAWRWASAYITRKLEEGKPEEAPKEEDFDDEFGGAKQRGRSHTLLPLLRKVIGTVLVIMVGLIVVSSMGVNIAPLLAGAGVVGLAVGFGAQKLVSDVLSGFFFLMDDAFRVGEYIQAGSIKGTVEAITLRNVMLRHHLGMLQVVPHSDLGAVTNFMRGGIVIKFPLEFPYDTDIDLVRRIIKKVGVAMLEEEEYGDDFIQPLKSQGVNSITNSVMVIRVKFTAKPGKQFVIKREAFRRITEALNAKGIYYAHRKVIVDFPEWANPATQDPQTRLKALEAGAAAALVLEAEEQQKLEEEAKKKE